jgi:hypothetical protein
MDVYEKLDIILDSIKQNYGRIPTDKIQEDLSEKINGNRDFNRDPVYTGLLNSLAKDGYIEWFRNTAEGGIEYYVPTVKGLTFNGFKVQQKKQKSVRFWDKFFEWLRPMAGVVLGAILGYYLKSDPVNNVNMKVDSPKYYGVDTIYLLNQKATKDTSLVRLVKRK